MKIGDILRNKNTRIATVRMNEDGTVQLFTGATSLGTGAHTALAQVVAEELGVRFEDVSVVHGDTDVVPWDIGAFASHTTYMGGRSAQMAAAQVKQQVLARASERLEAAPADLEIRQGVIGLKCSDRSNSMRDAVYMPEFRQLSTAVNTTAFMMWSA